MKASQSTRNDIKAHLLGAVSVLVLTFKKENVLDAFEITYENTFWEDTVL